MFTSLLKCKPLLILIGAFLFQNELKAQLKECRAVLLNDTLTLENSKIKRTFLWSDGALQGISLHNKLTGKLINGTKAAGKADFFFPGINLKATNGAFRVYDVAATNVNYAHLAAEVLVELGSIQFKRLFRLYPGCPAIVCDYFIKGKPGHWKSFVAQGESFKILKMKTVKKPRKGKL